MKALQRSPGSWDRMATREELCQVFDLLENIPTMEELARLQESPVRVNFAVSEGSQEEKKLWLDRSSEEEEAEEHVDANLESLAELFADRSGLVN